MATKLYPPIIEGTIPAFSGTVITVPFSLNRAVSKNQIQGFAIKIKTVQGGNIIYSKQQTDRSYWDLDYSPKVSFELTANEIAKFQVGQFYKVQLAFLSVSTDIIVGYYSTVGIIKYTSTPTVYIDGLNSIDSNPHKYTYVGVYSQKGKDSTEKLYSSQFTLYDAKRNIIIDSGEIIHNTNNDTELDEAHETFIISQDLEDGEIYYLKFQIKTANNLVVELSDYKIRQSSTLISNLNGTLSAKNNFDDGYITVSIVGKKDANGIESDCAGSFILSRAASNDNFTWHQICKFVIVDSMTSRELWNDFTTEQGVTYKYSLQEYNSKNIYSKRVISNEVIADFEDAFLYDGNRQLKIRYNPKVSSFKTDLQEAKQETIGSQYPFIFRNGNIYYKEFPISGLISYKMDENEFFETRDSISLEEDTFDLVTNNIFAERNFKMTVLEWLNNGEAKLFRSPSEGNYIVRLMSNSLAPTDSVGRMLHTFSSTAYEIANSEYDAMESYGFINTATVNSAIMKWMTVDLVSRSTDLDKLLTNLQIYLDSSIPVYFTHELYSRVVNSLPELNSYFIQKGTNAYILDAKINLEPETKAKLLSLIGTITWVSGMINTSPITSLDIRDMKPGTLISIQLKAGEAAEIIQIGATGAYHADFSENPAISISVIEDQTNNNILTDGFSGTVTYGYQSDAISTFDLISDFVPCEVPLRQWVGALDEEIYEIDNKLNFVTTNTNNIIKTIEDVKTDIAKISMIRALLRPLQTLFIKDIDSNGNEISQSFGINQKYYSDMDCTQEVKIQDLDEYCIYIINHGRFDYTYQGKPFPMDGYYVDANFFKESCYVDKNGVYHPVFTGKYLDGKSTATKQIIYSEEEYNTSVQINEDIIDVKEIERYVLDNIEDTISVLIPGNGTVVEVSYQTTVKSYTLEDDDVHVNALKGTYEGYINKMDALKKYRDSNISSQTDIDNYKLVLGSYYPGNNMSKLFKSEHELVLEIQKSYKAYIQALTASVYSYKKEYLS